MLDLVPKTTISKIAEQAGPLALGVLKLLFDTHQRVPVIKWEDVDNSIFCGATARDVNKVLDVGASVGVFDGGKLKNDGVLTSCLMQHVAVFTGAEIPEEHCLISADGATDAVHLALIEMFGAKANSLVVQNNVQSTGEVTREVTGEVFEHLWDLYPKRNGRRLGKSDAKRFFMANFKSKSKINLLERAILNYIEGLGEISARDMVRFMRNDFWLDWVDEAEDTSVGVSYESAVYDCKKNDLFPVSHHYEMRTDGLWYRINE